MSDYNPDPMSASRRKFSNRVAMATALERRSRVERQRAHDLDSTGKKAAANAAFAKADRLHQRSQELVKD